MTINIVDFEFGHKESLFNSRMKSWYAMGAITKDEAVNVLQQIETTDDWVRVLTKCGKDIETSGGDILQAAFKYRMAEFFTPANDPRKFELHSKFIDLFYEATHLKRELIPYDHSFMTGLYIPANGKSKGSVLFGGGYDSNMEDFLSLYELYSQNGYDIFAYEGPGQGSALKQYHLKMIPDWEKPTAVVLDHFKIKECTLIGASLGGYLSTRAAAFDMRIKRIVMWNLIWDFVPSLFSFNPEYGDKFIQMLENDNRAGVALVEQQCMQLLFFRWLLEHGCYSFGKDNCFDLFNAFLKYNTRTISKLITADVLVTAGSNDIYTPFFDEQMHACTNARSISGRIFTEEEHADSHCNVGNIPLVHGYIMNWIEEH